MEMEFSVDIANKIIMPTQRYQDKKMVELILYLWLKNWIAILLFGCDGIKGTILFYLQ